MQLTEDVNFTTEKKELLSEKIHDEILELIIKNMETSLERNNQLWPLTELL